MIRKEFISNPNLNLQGSSKTRHAVRGIIYQNSKFLLLYSERDGDYSFPGGGVEVGETEHEALRRELLEECGAEVLSIGPPIAEIIEFDSSTKADIDLFIRRNVYFSCRISNKYMEPCLMPYEKSKQCVPIWIEPHKALAANEMILQNPVSVSPRWTKRETFILNELKNKSIFY